MCFNCRMSGPWDELESKLKTPCPTKSMLEFENTTHISSEWDMVLQSSQPLHKVSDKVQQELFHSLNLGVNKIMKITSNLLPGLPDMH